MLPKRCSTLTFAVSILIVTILQCKGTPSVIIVGAGSAGIAAATKLLENHFTNITILEAKGRIGGRIHSTEFEDSVLDLGAQWCHGEKGNIVYELVKDFDLLQSAEVLMNFYHSSDKDLNRPFIKELYELFYDIYYQNIEEETSVADYMIKRYNKEVNNRFGDEPEKVKLAEEFLDFLMRTFLIEVGAFSWYDVSVKEDYKDCEGAHYLNWKNRGYKTILDVLMKRYPNPEDQLPIDDKLFFNKEVVKIVWDKSKDFQKAIVKCLDGSVYKADHVVFTPSLGVLKDRHKALFWPKLPQKKINIIQDLGIEAVGKIFFKFPKKWWPEKNFTDFSFIWSEEDREFLLQSRRPWLTNLVTFFTVAEIPAVLAGWFAGDFIPEIERTSDDVIVEGVMFALNKFLGHEYDNIPKPDSIVRYSWFSDRNFRGTYSYQTVESRASKVSPEIILSQPLKSSNGKLSLLFAGEATHPYYYGTVHGAIETGHREAYRIMNLYRLNL